MRIKDKVAIVTGAGAGIGKASALLFAEKGAKVLCNDISNTGSTTVEEIKSKGKEAIFIQGDISEPVTIQEIIDTAIKKYNRIDIVFNNAGIVIPGKAEDTSVKVWDRVMKVNVRSVFLMSKISLPHLIKTKGCIINNSSCAAIKGMKNRFAYSASKGAILSMTRAMAADYIKSGVRVNAICPGVVDSPSFQQRVASSDEPEKALANFISMQPLGRISNPQEIAESVLFLVNSEYCVGTCLSIDGGISM